MNLEQLKKIADIAMLEGDKIVIKSNFIDVLKCIKEEYSFDILKNITAVDLKENGIELIYHLFSTTNEVDLLLSITTKGETESVSNLFESAIADENEIFDLFGVKFIGNPQLKRLYMPEDWDGHPLKKDYVENDVRLNWNDKT